MTLTMFHIVSVSLFYGLVPGISVGGIVNENSVCKKETFFRYYWSANKDGNIFRGDCSRHAVKL